MCDPSGYKDLSLRFLAPQIPDAIYSKYFAGKKMQGMADPEFILLINGTVICLTCAILCHTLMAWQTGIYQDPPDFQGDRAGDLLARQEETWRNFEEDVQMAVIEDISRAIMARVQQNHKVVKVRREGYQDDMEKVSRELARRKAMQSSGRSGNVGQGGVGVRGLHPVRCLTGGNFQSQETDDSLDLGETAIDPELRFLGSSPPHVEYPYGISSLLTAENMRSPTPSVRLSLSLDDSQDAQGLFNPTSDPLQDGMDEGEAATSENLAQD
ncbi:hypothetical protein HOY82DRAFT_650478 [Tuber indicum]|nr:hypothetical protein HOY82DRAFT_650478 [Tuber indicum]